MRLYGKFRLEKDRDGEETINVSPLIDVVFILLIFFIVSATFVSLPGIKIKRPKAITAQSLERNSILFAISNNDKIFYGGEEIKLGEISNLIEEASRKKRKPVVVQIDQWADASLLAKVVANARISSSAVSIATRKPR